MTDKQFRDRLGTLAQYLVVAADHAKAIEAELAPFQVRAKVVHEIRGHIADAGRAAALALEGL